MLSYWPARNLLSSRQLMNASFNPLHLVNTYGAFGSVSRRRYEVSSRARPTSGRRRDAVARVRVPGKPGDSVACRAKFAPYHLRLDWLMWFLPLSAHYRRGWFHPLLIKLLEGDAAILRLFAHNPFPHQPPTYVRALLYEYRLPAGPSAAAAAPGGRAHSPRSSSNRSACRTAAAAHWRHCGRFVDTARREH